MDKWPGRHAHDRPDPCGVPAEPSRTPTDPALLRHALGSGATFLCTYPIEHFAAHTPAANPESTWRIYSALAEAARVSRPVRIDDPRVLVGRVRGPDGERAIFVNCSDETLRPEPLTAEGIQLGLGHGELVLDPFGVAVVRCDLERQGDDRVVRAQHS